MNTQTIPLVKGPPIAKSLQTQENKTHRKTETHWIGAWALLRAGLDAVECRIFRPSI
jgi:hypothetical protein